MYFEPFDIHDYMTKGVEKLVMAALRATLDDPKESAFMFRFAAASTTASRKRGKSEDKGEHIPPLLIADISKDETNGGQLEAKDWVRLFDEADGLGISFIVLEGKQILQQRNIIEAAGKRKNILFPILTDGKDIDERYYELFDECRNLVPFVSLKEGKKAIEGFAQRGLSFGVFLVSDGTDLQEITSGPFLNGLKEKGCKSVLYLALTISEPGKDRRPLNREARKGLYERIETVRRDHPELVFMSFPFETKDLDGCGAAGKSFFHIDPYGDAWPCPFLPCSQVNLRHHSLAEAIHSNLFRDLLKEEAIKGGDDCRNLAEKYRKQGH